MPKAIKIICFSLLIIGLLSFAYPVLAQGRSGPQSINCKEGIGNCEYPGQCHDYRDSNNDGHCDRIVASSTAAATTPAAQPVTNTGNTSSTSTGSTVNVTGNSPASSSSYNFLLLLSMAVAAYCATWLLSVKDVINTALHRKIWNVALLISSLAMLLLGLLLTLREEFNWNMQLPFDLTFWHVETGIIMGLIAVFHIAWHWRYFTRLMKPAGRQADK